jgi:hypothetical protein
MNKQEIISKYAKLAAKQLYGIENLNVEFPYDLTQGFKVYDGECSYHRDKTIRFNGVLFNENELYYLAWEVLMHELSHIKVLGHSEKFWEEMVSNFEKTMELREGFYKETGLDGDSYEDANFTPYYDDQLQPSNPNEVDFDEENLEEEDTFFEIYKMPGGFEN